MSSKRANGQSRKMSLTESIVSGIVGYIITVLVQLYLYPLFGFHIDIGKSLIISIIVVSIAFLKNYIVRRTFNFLHLKRDSI